MILTFVSIQLHNFLSYAHAEVNLQNKHYCLVSGINNCQADNAQSNGVGKSTIGSAISWALTGQTIQGIKSDIKNINAADDQCYVELIFKVDSDSYKITRYKSPKSDLKIVCNDVDISGKGIKESENILSTRLPDLTVELIASTIILGQGLPLKFTNNTPSGRKDILEKLSKSDFMIQDLKERISKRQNELNNLLRAKEDLILQCDTKIQILIAQKSQLELKLKALEDETDFDARLEELNNKILNFQNQKQILSKSIEFIQRENLQITAQLNLTLENKNKDIMAETAEFNAFQNEYLRKKYDLQSQIDRLKQHIDEIANIKEVCPTCGQKLPNIIKPSTEADQQQVKKLEEDLLVLNNKFISAKKDFDSIISQINTEFNLTLKKAEQSNNDLADKTSSEKAIDLQLNQLLIDRSMVLNQKQNHAENIKTTTENLMQLQSQLDQSNTEKLYNINERDNISNHIAVINQMNTFIKRDFRGFLLNDIISFINQKAKIYSNDIFGNDQIQFNLDGNNIDITFCNKPFEVLSGGEQQRIDLIIQFSIRDMLQEYLNFSSNILFLDEIFDQLDAVAVNAVLECILKRLCDIDSVFIISHRAGELEIPYDSELVITKDKNGISTLISR